MFICYKKINIILKKNSTNIQKIIFFLNRKREINLEIFYKITINIPNSLEKNILDGHNERNNNIIRTMGKIQKRNFIILPHYKLIKDNVDFDIVTRICGSKLVILKKDLSKLERALINFMIDVHTLEFGYEEISLPVFISEKSMFKAGQLPKFHFESFKTMNNYRLIPTSEVSLINMLNNKILNKHILPLRYVSHTQCFRYESVNNKKDLKGILRLYQFSKVELVSITHPSKSNNEFNRIITIIEKILKQLKLCYRISNLCSREITFSSKKTYDIEVWLPSQKIYKEISSCSNCGNFQSSRINSKYLLLNKKYFTHTLNGSALPISRTIALILENYQDKNGNILIPHCLQPYLGKQKIIFNKERK